MLDDQKELRRALQDAKLLHRVLGKQLSRCWGDCVIAGHEKPVGHVKNAIDAMVEALYALDFTVEGKQALAYNKIMAQARRSDHVRHISRGEDGTETYCGAHPTPRDAAYSVVVSDGKFTNVGRNFTRFCEGCGDCAAVVYRELLLSKVQVVDVENPDSPDQ